MKLLTIFTPVYNRANLIERLYNSLLVQTDKRFEWIIVDDESNDDIEFVVSKAISNNNGFPIYFYKQNHGGKHRAINLALKYAKGDYFFIIDSDDYIFEDTVATVQEWIENIPPNSNVAGVAGLRISSNGNIWGGDPTKSCISKGYIEASNFERFKYHILGDKAEIYNTILLKKYPFPEFENEFFITENVCWDAIAADGYIIRWYNRPIYVCDYLDDGLTKNGSNEIVGHIRNYNGYCYYIKQSLKIVPIKERMIRFRWFNKTRKVLNKSIANAASDLQVTPLKYIYYLYFVMPFTYAIRQFDKWIFIIKYHISSKT